MKQNAILVVTSLLSILLLTLHVTDSRCSDRRGHRVDADRSTLLKVAGRQW